MFNLSYDVFPTFYLFQQHLLKEAILFQFSKLPTFFFCYNRRHILNRACNLINIFFRCLLQNYLKSCKHLWIQLCRCAIRGCWCSCFKCLQQWSPLRVRLCQQQFPKLLLRYLWRYLMQHIFLQPCCYQCWIRQKWRILENPQLMEHCLGRIWLHENCIRQEHLQHWALCLGAVFVNCCPFSYSTLKLKKCTKYWKKLGN